MNAPRRGSATDLSPRRRNFLHPIYSPYIPIGTPGSMHHARVSSFMLGIGSAPSVGSDPQPAGAIGG
jgi:hypothetical protein